MSFIQVPFRDKSFFITTVGSATPDYVKQSFLQLEKEMREAWWQVQRGDVVIDVGAAYGSYTLSALACGASKIIFFEPSKTEFFDICSSVLINGWIDRCIPQNCLAGETNGSNIPYYPASHSDRPEGQQEQRLQVMIDTVVEAYSISKVHWIKIDTEGAEPEVLKGALRTLERDHPKLLIENHVGFRPGVDELVKQILKPLNYLAVAEHKGVGINDLWTLFEAYP